MLPELVCPGWRGHAGMLAGSMCLFVGCFQATPWPPCTVEAGPECFDTTGAGQNTEPGSTTAGTNPTGGVQTVTGAAATTEPEVTTAISSTTGVAENPPPVIESFGVSDDLDGDNHLSEAGTARLKLVASEDAVEIRLSLNGNLLAELAPGDFPFAYEVLSDKFNFEHDFEAVAVDAEGLESVPAVATLTVEVPPSGTEKCLFDADKNDAGVDFSMVAGLAYADDGIVVVGTRGVGAGSRLALWKLDRDHCELVLPGWPKTGIGMLKDEVSEGTALALDEDGNLFVAGFMLEGVQPVRYLAKLNPGGSVLWEALGQAGEEIAGLAVAPKPQAAVFAVGWRRSTNEPSPTDAAIWMYKLDGTPFPPDYMKAPFTPDEKSDDFNDFSERLHAVVFEPTTGLAVAVGERDFEGDNFVVYSRTFLVRVHPLTGLAGTAWTSPGESFAHDAALGVASCEGELVAAGWRRDAPPDADPEPMLQWFAADGTPTGFRSIPLSSANLRGVACDRELKVVGAGSQDVGLGDAKVLAAPGLEGPLAWYESGNAGADEAVAASCDRRGFCAWGGFRTAAGKRHAVVRVHHP